MTDNLAIFTPETLPPDPGAVQQMETCLAEHGAVGVLCADHHKGYSMPIGGAIAYPDHVSPSGVGYDIGCGNKAVATNLLASDVRRDMGHIMDEVTRQVSFGMGRSDGRAADHPYFDGFRERAPLAAIRRMEGLARQQLGTVGGGNHYVDLFEEAGTGRLWVGVHFGSRGLGHKIATGFMAMAQGKDFTERPTDTGMDAKPDLLPIEGPLGHLYIESMELAGDYAYAGRDVVCQQVLDILGAQEVRSVHNHHNFAWREDVLGMSRGAWVVRKGCTPLWPGQQGFVGGSMGENAVIIEGLQAPEAAAALWSAPHGAGRVMSRTEAKGRARKRSRCGRCGHTQQPSTPKFEACPSCNASNVEQVWVQEQAGKVDWKIAQDRLKFQGIVLRGGEADEAPEAYKRLPEVLKAHESYVKVVTQLRPIGVAMAGPGVKDPFKD